MTKLFHGFDRFMEGGKFVSRYTGSEYKRSRSVGFSTTETGK